MINTKKIFSFIILLLFLVGCTSQERINEKSMESTEELIDKTNTETIEDSIIEDNIQELNNKDYSGHILAGTTTKYIEFNKADYDTAVSENKIILLYF